MTLRTSAAPSGPVVTSTEVTFRFPDPDARLSGVRLAQQVRIPGDRLEFTRRGGIWQLTLPRPPVWRMEYRLELRHPDGGVEEVCDPANPLRAPGAFGDKSVLEFPATGRRPGWTRRCCPARRPSWPCPRATCGPRSRSGSGRRRTPTRPSRCRCWSRTTVRSTTRCPA